MKRLTTLLYLGTLLTLPPATLTLASPPTAAGELVAQIPPQQVQQRAAAITVKVWAGDRSGSGVIIKRDGDTYSVLTNRHVVESGRPLRVQAPDGEVYQNVEAVSLPANRDLAILEFAATAEYATAPLANLSELRGQEEVFAAGYPFAANPTEPAGLVVTGGQLLALPERELMEGYRLGYEGDIEKGMSGGPIFNGEGEVVGINGIHAYPLWGDPYVYEDGSKPTAEQREVMSRLNWGIPIQTVAELVSGYVAVVPAAGETTPIEGAVLPLSYDVERLAEKITVLIRWGSGNGSGVIVARQGDVYYVLTAEHVVRNKMEFEIVTHDGERHRVRVSGESVKTLPGADLAVVQFRSGASYPVAAVADYDLTLGYESRLVFASGWGAVAGVEPERRFSAGMVLSKEWERWGTSGDFSLSYGYGLVYSNITRAGMSGGPVFDSRGRLLGIHGRADGATAVDEAVSTTAGVVYLGYSLGVPIKSFLSSAESLGVNREWLQVKSDLPPSESAADIETILERELAKLERVESPGECRDVVECVNYGNQLWRLGRGGEALIALQRATKMQPSFYGAWYAKGLALYSERQYEEAMAAFEKAAQAKEVSSEQLAATLRWRAKLLWHFNRYEEALASLEKAIALNPHDEFVLDLLQKLQRYQEIISRNELNKTAEKITVLIEWGNRNGSGVIVAKQEDVYYVLTAEHVVRNKTEFEIVTHDGERYLVKVNPENIKTMPGVDLAVVQFNSSTSYQVATVADYDLPSGNETGFVFASGWSSSTTTDGKPERRFSAGKVYSREEGRLRGQTYNSFSYGYRLVYTNLTTKGMSGGPILDSQGRLVAIHGRADGETPVDETSSAAGVVYLGFSLGVPIKSFLTSADNLGVNRDWLKLKSDPPLPLTAAEKLAIIEAELEGVKVKAPDECENAIACVNYGNQLWRLGRGEEALVALHRATEMQPNFYGAWYAKGLALFSEKHYEKAVAAFERATQAKGAGKENLAAAWRWHGNALVWLNRYEEGLASTERAIALDLRDFSSYWLKGWFLNQLKHHEEAIAAYTKAIDIEPHSWAYNNRGIARRDLGDIQGAMADFNRAIELDPDYAAAYDSRGNARRDLGDRQGATADFNRATELDQNYKKHPCVSEQGPLLVCPP